MPPKRTSAGTVKPTHHASGRINVEGIEEPRAVASPWLRGPRVR
jgi:hypothetical protein